MVTMLISGYVTFRRRGSVSSTKWSRMLAESFLGMAMNFGSRDPPVGTSTTESMNRVALFVPDYLAWYNRPGFVFVKPELRLSDIDEFLFGITAHNTHSSMTALSFSGTAC